MSAPETQASGSGALDLPPFFLDVQALDLGNDVKAVGLELVETESREPVRGKEAADSCSQGRAERSHAPKNRADAAHALHAEAVQQQSARQLQQRVRPVVGARQIAEHDG